MQVIFNGSTIAIQRYTSAMEFEVKGKRKRERRKKTWKTQVEKESKSVGLEKEDALNRARWRVGVGEIAFRVG